MKLYPRYRSIWILFLLLPACNNRVSQEDLIQAAVEIRIRQWEETQLAQCKDRAMEKAEDYVDSLLLATSLQSKLDTIPKPSKPVKPPKPVFREKPDSVVVKPIYKKDQE